MRDTINVFWFRRDLRLDDNVGFYNALKSDYPVLPIFIFDKEILDKLPKDDARLTFIHETLQKMRAKLEDKNESSIALFHGNPVEIYKELLLKYKIHTVFTNRDYEPYAKKRDD
ncbi:MAG: deoxyribodipyrimidine photo-lyase, partial [Polaribacter sp.]